MNDASDRLSKQTRECITELMACHSICLSAAMTRQLEADHSHNRPQHLRLMLDCAEICVFTADALARKSQFHSPICALCADICETAAKDFQQLTGFTDCAEACLRAAAHVQDMARFEHAEILAMAARLPPDP